VARLVALARPGSVVPVVALVALAVRPDSVALVALAVRPDSVAPVALRARLVQPGQPGNKALRH